MHPDLTFDFVVDETACTLTITREFAAARQLVWDCYTKSELLDQWFAPKTFTTKTRSMDFSEGGHWHYAMVDADGKEYWGRTNYLTINPIDNYTAKDGFSDESGEVNQDLPQSHWDVTFADADERCVVTNIVTYESADDLNKVIEMGMKEGMTSTLEGLDELLDRLTR